VSRWRQQPVFEALRLANAARNASLDCQIAVAAEQRAALAHRGAEARLARNDPAEQAEYTAALWAAIRGE
jgi:hypothetical protein